MAWPRGDGAALKSIQSVETLRCSWPVAETLLGADGDDAALRERLREDGLPDPDATIAAARAVGVLLTEAELRAAQRFHEPWVWGPLARALIFGYEGPAYADRDTELDVRAERETAAVALLPDARRQDIALPEPPPGALVGLLRERRSRRAFDRGPLAPSALAACLSAGFGLTGERVADNGRELPLTAAPAPGALNTYDALVLARSVEGLEPGTYRYLPQTHGLARETGTSVAFEALFGGQQWAAQAACAVVLLADLRRPASKYAYPTTLAAVIVEAGARVELMLLAAAESSLAAVVVGLAGVGAFDRGLAADAGIWGETSMTVPICAVLLGMPAAAERGDGRDAGIRSNA